MDHQPCFQRMERFPVQETMVHGVHTLQMHIVSGLFAGTPIENTSGDYRELLEIEDAIYRSAAGGRKNWLESW